MTQAVSGLGKTDLNQALINTGTNLLVAGVLHQYDKDAARSYLESAIGNEAGQFIGQGIAGLIREYGLLPKEKGIVYDNNKGTFVDRDTGTTYDPNKGGFVDDRGNVVFAFRKPDEGLQDEGLPKGSSLAAVPQPEANRSAANAPGQGQLSGPQYEVKKNDTLSGIAGGNPALLAAILLANQDQITDINLLKPGQKLIIPSLVSMSETDLAELDSAGRQYLEVAAAVQRAKEAERTNAAALEQVQRNLADVNVPTPDGGPEPAVAVAGSNVSAPASAPISDNAAVKTLISIIEPFAAANQKLEKLRADYPWLAKTVEIGARTLTGGPVAAVIKTIAGEATSRALGPVISEKIIQPILQYAADKGLDVERTLYLLGGVKLIADVALGVKIPIKSRDAIKMEMAARRNKNGDGPDPSAGNPALAHPKTNTPGNVILGELDQYGRPTGVTAVLKQEMLSTGSSANPSIRPPGFGGQGANHARGHLLANTLGGSGDDSRNLVTLFQRNANHPNMSSFERQVRVAVQGGETVSFRAIPVYSGSSPVPIGVTLTARGSGGFKLDVSVPNVNGVR